MTIIINTTPIFSVLLKPQQNRTSCCIPHMVKMSSSTAIRYFFHLPTMLALEDMIWGHSLAARFLTRVPTVARTAGDLYKKKKKKKQEHDYLTIFFFFPSSWFFIIHHVLQERWYQFVVQVDMWYVRMWSGLRVVHLKTNLSFWGGVGGISERLTFFSGVMLFILTEVCLKGNH